MSSFYVNLWKIGTFGCKVLVAVEFLNDE